MIYGYMRVSTKEQSFESQKKLLLETHCDQIIFEKTSGVKQKKELEKLMKKLRKGDSLVVTRLDRLSRTLKDLINIVEQLSQKDVNFISILDKIDTSTAIGRLFFHINAAYAQFERERLIDRTKEGLEAARNAGRIFGRKPGLTEDAEKKAEFAAVLYKEYCRDPQYSISELCQIVGVSRATFYKYLRLKNVYK